MLTGLDVSRHVYNLTDCSIRVFHCVGPEDCNIGKREKGQASSGDDKTSSTTCDTTSDRTSVPVGTDVVAALGVERTETTSTDKSTHINSDDVTNDDTQHKTGDVVEGDNDSDMPSGEGEHDNKPNNVDNDNTSPKRSDTLCQEVTSANGTTGDVTLERNANTDGDSDRTVSTPSDIPQEEQTTDTPQCSGHTTSEDTEDITDSLSTPGAAGTTHSVGTSSSSNEEKNRRILERFMRRMKESQHGHRLKLLRPELVKAFIQ